MKQYATGFLVVALVLVVIAAAAPVAAHDYEPGDSDYPLRYVAYALYPIGYIGETLIKRPIHWAVSQPYARIFFGHAPRNERDEQGNYPVAPIARPAPEVMECPKCHLPVLKPRDQYWDRRLFP